MSAQKLKGKHGPEVQELYEKSLLARERSYSPYSKCKVGAALRLSDGRIFTGCNVENASYGGAVCAERTAVLKAVSESQGPVSIAEIVVVTDATPPWPPCGFCRQVIAEFGSPKTRIHATNLQGEVVSSDFGVLFPNAFTPEHLK
jgi:cytidine deaminase